MLDKYIIVGAAFFLMELFKKIFKLEEKLGEDVSGKIHAIAVFVLSGLLNMGNAALFSTVAVTWPVLQSALLIGLEAGAIASGLYGAGKQFWPTTEE